MSFKFLNSPGRENHRDLENNEINCKCSKCGSCCNAAPLPTTKKEMSLIADYVYKHNITRLNRDWVPEAMSNSNGKTLNVDLRCCFYDSEKKECTIYPVRPAICREFKCSNSIGPREEIKARLHLHADYNTTNKPSSSFSFPTKVTNLDLIIYGDILPLSIYFQFFTGIDARGFAEVFNKFGCLDTYNLEEILKSKNNEK